MKELVDVFNHLSLLPSVNFQSDTYNHILRKKLESLQFGITRKDLIDNLNRIYCIIPQLKNLPPEINHLLRDIETICTDISDYLEKGSSIQELKGKIQKGKRIVEKIDRVLFTYIAEDSKRYLRYSLLIREIYWILGNTIELLKEIKEEAGIES